MGFITSEGLETIKNHKYVSGTWTYLDTAMNPFWNRFANLIPLNIAPNLVTLTGLLFPFTCSIFLLCLDTT